MYPKLVYLTKDKYIRVNNEFEEKAAKSNGFRSVDEILNEIKGIKEPFKEFTPHTGDVLVSKDPKVEYEKETGKKAIWKGKITKAFREWNNGNG